MRLLLKFKRLAAVMTRLSSIFPRKPFCWRFWTTLFVPRPDNPVIYLRVFSALGITTLGIAVKTESWTGFLIAATTLSSSFFTFLAMFLSVTWTRLSLFSPAIAFPLLLVTPSFGVSTVLFSVTPALIMLPVTASSKKLSNCLTSLWFCCFFYRSKQCLY